MQNYWNLYLACKQQQLYGPVNYRDFRETGPGSENGLKIDSPTNNSQEYPLLQGKQLKRIIPLSDRFQL